MKMGEYIRRKRKEKNISLRKFAKEVGISPTMMSKVEHDEIGFKAGAETIKRIASLLGVNSDELLARDGKVDPILIDEIVARPKLLPFLIRALACVSDLELHQLIEFMKGLKNAEVADKETE